MFADQWHEHHRKRCREEDDAELSAGGPMGFTEHRTKRLQSLPLRTSKRCVDTPSFPLSNPTFVISRPSRTVTQGAEEPSREQHMWAEEPEMVHQEPSSAMAPGMFDSDMDMMDTSEPVWGRGQPDHHDQPTFEPGKFQTDPTVPSVTGRIPTPIHCSFASQVRGSNWNGGFATAGQGDALATTPEEPNATAFSTNGLVDITCQRLSMMGHENVPLALDGAAAAAQVMADWNMVQNRRLPSPISECGAEDILENPGMVFDHSSSRFGGHLGHLTHEHPFLANLPPRASSAIEMGRSARESTPAAEHLIGNAMDVESPGMPSPKKGHTRSKHTVNSWTTLQPGMKRSFSIGYRADCEKCRMKVPGHFNHIIVS